ncbi:MAG TPA: signal peptidase I [Armatimonadota bacterium]|nr:signal peptidase I [Armatimonadota bacterium]
MQDAKPFPIRDALHPEQARPQPRAARRRSSWRPIWDIAIRALIVFFIVQTWVMQGYRVFGSCMEPNLCTGERLLGSKLALASGIHRGDVVVFHPPHRPDTAFIKRIIGLPGETIEIRNNRVYVNDRELNEPYLHRAWHDDRPPERIADDKVFVMGDNRDNSNDSRMWGELPVRNIQAKAWVRYWPLNRFGWVD